MIVGILKERESEPRVAATPNTVKDLIKCGLSVHVESHAGENSFISDDNSSTLSLFFTSSM